jgi:hypothetical protein
VDASHIRLLLEETRFLSRGEFSEKFQPGAEKRRTKVLALNWSDAIKNMERI